MLLTTGEVKHKVIHVIIELYTPESGKRQSRRKMLDDGRGKAGHRLSNSYHRGGGPTTVPKKKCGKPWTLSSLRRPQRGI